MAPCCAPVAANLVPTLNLAFLFLMGEISPEEVAQGMEPAQVEGHIAFLAGDLFGGVINAFISGVPELTVLAWRSSIFT